MFRASKVVFLRDLTIRRGDIPLYMESEEFFSAFRIWKNWMRYGFYESGGRKNQPVEVLKIIDIFEDERAFSEAERVAKMRGEHDDTRN